MKVAVPVQKKTCSCIPRETCCSITRDTIVHKIWVLNRRIATVKCRYAKSGPYPSVTKSSAVIRLGNLKLKSSYNSTFTRAQFHPFGRDQLVRLDQPMFVIEVVCQASLLQSKIGISRCSICVIEQSLLQPATITAVSIQREAKNTLYWTMFGPDTQKCTCSLVSYIEGLDSEKLAPNLVQRLITFSSPKMRWTATAEQSK